jgi:hypothetical protein
VPTSSSSAVEALGGGAPESAWSLLAAEARSLDSSSSAAAVELARASAEPIDSSWKGNKRDHRICEQQCDHCMHARRCRSKWYCAVRAPTATGSGQHTREETRTITRASPSAPLARLTFI